MNPPAHLRWCDGRVKYLSFKLNFPFFMPSRLPWVPGIRQAARADRTSEPFFLYPLAASSRFRPLSLYPLADKGLGPVLGPLSLYPLAISALSYIPFGRFGPICRHFGPYRSTLWPTAPVGGPYRATLWPIRHLATYPLADSGRFFVISALIALPCDRLRLLGAPIALPFGRFGT